jgi:hypothetical protein
MSYTSAVLMLLAAVRADATVPTSADIAKALTTFTHRRVSVAGIRHISCRRFEEEPGEATCRWQQRRHGRWLSYAATVAVDASGWQLIDEPGPIS